MPATFDTLIGHVRRKCHYPQYQKLPDSTIAAVLLGQIDELTTELNLAGQLWIVRQTIITVNDGDDIIPITADGFGRPITVETYDASDPNLDTREVDMVNEPELVRYFGGGDPGPWDRCNFRLQAVAAAFLILRLFADWRTNRSPQPSRYQCHTPSGGRG